MIVLWDSSTMECRLTLVENGNRHDYTWEAGRSLARDMLGYLRDRLAEHGRSFSDISAIGVFRGPGSFTGLRIGMTVLNTIAGELSVPIVGTNGETWQQVAEERLRRDEDDKIVLPEYGGEAHVTKPRK